MLPDLAKWIFTILYFPNDQNVNNYQPNAIINFKLQTKPIVLLKNSEFGRRVSWLARNIYCCNDRIARVSI